MKTMRDVSSVTAWKEDSIPPAQALAVVNLGEDDSQERLQKSIHRIETQLPSQIKSYAAAASSPAPEKPVPLPSRKELRKIQIRRRDLSPEEETKTPAELLVFIRPRFARLALGSILAIQSSLHIVNSFDGKSSIIGKDSGCPNWYPMIQHKLFLSDVKSPLLS